MNLQIILFSGIMDLSVFHKSNWQEGELESGILSASPNPHEVARQIHRKYSGKAESLTLHAPQSRLNLPENCRNNFFGVYPVLLTQEVQEHLTTLFPKEVKISYAEC